MSNQQDAINVFKGLGHGTLALLGLGEAWDPLSDVRSELSEAQSTLQDTLNIGMISAFKTQNQVNQSFYEWIITNNSVIQETMKYYNTLVTNNLGQQSTFLSLTVLLVFIIVIYLLF